MGFIQDKLHMKAAFFIAFFDKGPELFHSPGFY